LIIKALWLTGLRVSELLSIRYDDIKSDWSVVIMWKWRKERRIFFNEELQKQSNFYKRTREESNLVSDYIFVSHANNSRWKKLSRNSVEVLIRNTNKKLWVEEKITPHSFRHGFATYVVRRWGNLVDLQHTLWHSNISITSMYLHSEASRVKALQKLVE
jgi:integrase/recombinase XerD